MCVPTHGNSAIDSADKGNCFVFNSVMLLIPAALTTEFPDFLHSTFATPLGKLNSRSTCCKSLQLIVLACGDWKRFDKSVNDESWKEKADNVSRADAKAEHFAAQGGCLGSPSEDFGWIYFKRRTRWWNSKTQKIYLKWLCCSSCVPTLQNAILNFNLTTLYDGTFQSRSGVCFMSVTWPVYCLVGVAEFCELYCSTGILENHLPNAQTNCLQSQKNFKCIGRGNS